MSEPFPSLIIRRDGFEPRGSYAEAQSVYLEPDAGAVAELTSVLEKKRIGVVAHFYMDAELQGVLSATSWPHVHISDSLQMADRAVKMVEAGARSVVVLGVDFMSENVRAVLDAAGHAAIPVYRLRPDPIGCSLAESAESEAYLDWLHEARRRGRGLHVVYINTSLVTKARAHAIVPTITCTSSNVVQTLLQAAAQIPDAHLWYGPDTYMGRNLASLLTQLAGLPDSEIAKVHPAHSRATLVELLGRYHHYPRGICIVHHLFGDDVARRVREEHADAFWTAHLEVPGEMFALAAEAQRTGRGVVGSTSNILTFIGDRVRQRLHSAGPERLSFVLGTEAGMVTSIVRQTRALLASRPDLDVEIVFPVASEAVAESDLLGIVPGVAAGEGCSAAGGCATCPFMKKNDLQALFDVVDAIDTDAERHLGPYAPKVYTESIAGRTAADLGTEPILHMRHFQKTGQLPAALVEAVR